MGWRCTHTHTRSHTPLTHKHTHTCTHTHAHTHLQVTNLELGFPAHVTHVITPDSYLYNTSLLEMDTRMMEVCFSGLFYVCVCVFGCVQVSVEVQMCVLWVCASVLCAWVCVCLWVCASLCGSSNVCALGVCECSVRFGCVCVCVQVIYALWVCVCASDLCALGACVCASVLCAMGG